MVQHLTQLGQFVPSLDKLNFKTQRKGPMRAQGLCSSVSLPTLWVLLFLHVQAKLSLLHCLSPSCCAALRGVWLHPPSAS